MNSFFNELSRRNIFRFAGVYAVVGWLIIQLGIALEGTLNLPDWFDTLVTTLVLIGFPIAILFAWAFELTPDGMKRTESVAPDESITSQTSRKLDFAILGGLAIVGGLLAFQTFSPRTSSHAAITASQASDASIAVLPFVNLSSDPDQEYFSDGISEELLNLFAKIPNLHVTSRSSAFAFKGKDINIPEVAAQLGVAHVLEGSVRKSGTRLRITAQLIEAESDKHLWSETYDRELDDIFAVQDEISAAIVMALQGILGVEGETIAAPAATRTVNAEAYQAFLRGNAISVQRTGPAKRAAQVEYRKAIELDPNYAPAYAMLAGTYSSLNKRDGGYGDLTLQEIEENAEPLLEKALSLDPDLAVTHAEIGRLRIDQGRYEEALASLEKAIALNPNDAQTYNDLAIYYQSTGEVDKILDVLGKAYRLDPLDTRSATNLSLIMVFRGELDRAEAIARNVVLLAPTAAYRRLSDIAFERGDEAAAIDHMLSSLEADPTNTAILGTLAWLIALEGHTQEALAIRAEVEEFIYLGAVDTANALQTAKDEFASDPDNIDAMTGLGAAHIQAGEWTEARRFLERAYEQTDGTFEIPDLASLYNARRKTGDADGAEALLPNVESALQAQEDAGWVSRFHKSDQASALAILGDMDEALVRLRQSIEQGGLGSGDLARSVSWEFEPVFDDPRFIEITELADAKNEAYMRALFNRLCTPPSEKFWQPDAQTCGKMKDQYGLNYEGLGE